LENTPRFSKKMITRILVPNSALRMRWVQWWIRKLRFLTRLPIDMTPTLGGSGGQLIVRPMSPFPRRSWRSRRTNVNTTGKKPLPLHPQIHRLLTTQRPSLPRLLPGNRRLRPPAINEKLRRGKSSHFTWRSSQSQRSCGAWQSANDRHEKIDPASYRPGWL